MSLTVRSGAYAADLLRGIGAADALARSASPTGGARGEAFGDFSAFDAGRGGTVSVSDGGLVPDVGHAARQVASYIVDA